jgi:hypothetical protein
MLNAVWLILCATHSDSYLVHRWKHNMLRRRQFLIRDNLVLMWSQPWELRRVCFLVMDHAILGLHAAFLIHPLLLNQYASSISHYRYDFSYFILFYVIGWSFTFCWLMSSSFKFVAQAVNLGCFSVLLVARVFIHNISVWPNSMQYNE